MNRDALNRYISPRTRQALTIRAGECDAIMEGALVGAADESYPVEGGIVDFTAGLMLEGADSQARISYDAQAGEAYANAMRWLWEAFLENEEKVRTQILDELDIQPGQAILEVGCGAGADSLRIAKRMKGGELYLQDISRGMLVECQKNFAMNADVGADRVEFSVSLTSPLPFADAQFDRVFHFGGLNMFSDIAGALSEMARVTKKAGKVVVGDESVGPWLRGDDFGRIVINNNPLYRAKLPLDMLPVSARDVRVQYLVSNTFYLISFGVGEGAPSLNLDLPHQGRRGGTLRTRFYGQLEGVSVEAREMAQKAAAASGKSMHQWLDELVRRQAQQDLKKP